MQANSKAGLGEASKPLLVDTKPATSAPKPPFEPPRLLPSSLNEQCTALNLKLPPLRGGCAGDQSYTLEMSSGGGGWKPVFEGHTADSAVVDSIDPYSAHKFRLLSVNSVGRSSPGPESALMLTDPERTILSSPPRAKATSSASFHISWQTSSCRPQLLWEVLYSLHNETGASQQGWHPLARGISGGEFEAPALRCPAGCAFRVHPLELKGWEQYSQACPHGPFLGGGKR